MALERTLIILKPDAVARGLSGRILARFEEKGLRVAGMKLVRVPKTTARKHYAEHRGKPFYDGLVSFITAGPVVLLVLEGKNAIGVCRTLVGATNGAEAAPGTIRGDFGMSYRFNLVHASDSVRSARREIGLYFSGKELHATPQEQLAWTYDWSDGKPV